MINKPDSKPVLSPCIGNCCLDDKDMCLGCFRMLDDIVGWSQKPDEDKLRVIRKCQQRKSENKPSF